MLGRDPFADPSQPSLAVAANPHAIQATPSLSPEKHIMQTRVAVRDKTPHRFQVVPLREISKQKDLLDNDGPPVPAFHAGTLLCSPSGNLPPPARSPSKEIKDPFDRSYRDMHWKKFGTLPRSIPLSQVMDLTKPASPTPIRPPPRNVLSDVDPNQSRAPSRHNASRPPPLDPSVSLGLQQRKRAQNATAAHQRTSSSSRYATSSSLVLPPPTSMIPPTRAPAFGTAEPLSSEPALVGPPPNAMVRRAGRRKGRTMSENALSEEMRQGDTSENTRASRRHAMYRQSLHFLDITRDLGPTLDDISPEADEDVPEDPALEAAAGPTAQNLGDRLAARSRRIAKSILERAMGEPSQRTLAPEIYTQPLRWKFPKRTVRRAPSFDAEADLGPLPAPTDITYSPIVLSLFAEIDQAIEEWKTVGN